MDTNATFILGALTDLFPPDLTPERLHDFTGANIGLCVRILAATRDLRQKEDLEFTEGIFEERLKERIERRFCRVT